MLPSKIIWKIIIGNLTAWGWTIWWHKASLLILLPGIEPKLLRLRREHSSPELQRTAAICADISSSYSSWARQGMFLPHKKRNIFGNGRLFLSEKRHHFQKLYLKIRTGCPLSWSWPGQDSNADIWHESRAAYPGTRGDYWLRPFFYWPLCSAKQKVFSLSLRNEHIWEDFSLNEPIFFKHVLQKKIVIRLQQGLNQGHLHIRWAFHLWATSDFIRMLF